jgi:tryptophan-rich sensory protein
MSRKTSDMSSGVSADRERVRELNAGMVERLLTSPPQPLGEGGLALRVLQATGRVSRRARRTPLGVARVQGRDYLVSPEPGREWVANLTVCPDCVLLAGDDRHPHRAVPAGGDEAAAAVATYLSATSAPWVRDAFPVSPGASRGEIAAALDGIAVFRLDPAGRGDAAAGRAAGGSERAGRSASRTGVLAAGLPPLTAALIGSIGARRAPEVYGRLAKPAWAPPAWLFAPVWSGLYALLGVAGWRMWARRVPARTWVLHGCQLVCNAAWPLAFFTAGNKRASLMVIGALDALLATEIADLTSRERSAAPALCPCLGWAGFATALNAAVTDPRTVPGSVDA